MKKLLLFAFLFCLIGCGNNEQVKLIESYVCTNDGVLSDLKFKSIKLEEIAPITVIDSMFYFVYEKRLLKYSSVGDSFNITLENDNGEQYNQVFKRSFIDESLISYKKIKESWSDIIDETDKSINDLQREMREHFNPYFDYTYHLDVNINMKKEAIEDLFEADRVILSYEKAKKYSLMPSNTVLLRTFDCTYSIIIPLLQVKQTQTRTFFFDNSLTKVVGSSDIKK